MNEKSWFDPQRYYTDHAAYAPFARFDVPAIGRMMSMIYDEESVLPFRKKLLDDDTNVLAEHLAELPLFRGDPQSDARRFSAQLQRMFNLDQLVLLLSMGKPNFFGEVVEVEGEQLVRDVLREDGNAVFVQPHYGPHFAMTLILAKLGIKVTCGGAMTEPFIRGTVELGNAVGAPVDRSQGILFTDDFKARCMECLAGGNSLMLYPEYTRSTRTGRLLIPFLGTEVHGPTGVARLAAGFGKRMVGVALEPIGTFKYRLRFGPVWSVDAARGEDGIHDAIRSVFGWFEKLVLASPGHWECWRYFQYMKSNTLAVGLRSLAEELRSRVEARP